MQVFTVAFFQFFNLIKFLIINQLLLSLRAFLRIYTKN